MKKHIEIIGTNMIIEDRHASKEGYRDFVMKRLFYKFGEYMHEKVDELPIEISTKKELNPYEPGELIEIKAILISEERLKELLAYERTVKSWR